MIGNTLKNKASQKPKLDFETIMKLVLFMYIDNTANGIRSKSNTCRGYFMAAREYDFLSSSAASISHEWTKQTSDRYLQHEKQRRIQGGPGVPVTPPFCKPFLTKQPRTGGENAMTFQLENVQTNEYPHFDTVWPPIWKIVATPMTRR